MEGPKFEIGQKIKFINDPDSKAGEVVGLSYIAPETPEDKGKWQYKITSKFVDMELEEVKPGFKTGFEDEFVEVKDVEIKEEE